MTATTQTSLLDAKRRRNALSQAEAYRLHKWFDALPAEDLNLPHAELAARASDTLEFRVTANNLAACYEVTGRLPPGPAPTIEERVVALEKQVAGFAAIVRGHLTTGAP